MAGDDPARFGVIHVGNGWSDYKRCGSEPETLQKITKMETTEQTSRAEHLAWCKKRALEYCDAGDVSQAYSSMASDLGKHSETVGHIGMELGMGLLIGGHLSTPEAMRKFIEGLD